MYNRFLIVNSILTIKFNFIIKFLCDLQEHINVEHFHEEAKGKLTANFKQKSIASTHLTYK